MAVYKTLLQKKKEGFLDIPIHKKTEIKKLGYGYNAFYAYRPNVDLLKILIYKAQWKTYQ